jgi:maltose O-acetyltransferase
MRNSSELISSPFKKNRITKMRNLGQAAIDETEGLHWRLMLAQLLMAPLPPYAGSRLRARLLTLAGFDIGKGTVVWGRIMLTGSGNLYQRLHIGEACWLNEGCHLDLSAPIHIGNRVALGHQVLLMTSTHEIGSPVRRAGEFVTRPIRIEDGAWLGSRCTILPGVSIGEGAIVAAGAMVTKDVLANTIVAGVPAAVVKQLAGE